MENITGDDVGGIMTPALASEVETPTSFTTSIRVGVDVADVSLYHVAVDNPSSPCLSRTVGVPKNMPMLLEPRSPCPPQ